MMSDESTAPDNTERDATNESKRIVEADPLHPIVRKTGARISAFYQKQRLIIKSI
jgi:hypothetical protein